MTTDCRPLTIEPLDFQLWVQRMKRVSAALEDDAPLENALRQSFHFAMLAPEALRTFAHASCSEAHFEELLARGEMRTAALMLIGEEFDLTISSTNRETQAQVALKSFEIIAASHSPDSAKAILSAWVEALLTLCRVSRFPESLEPQGLLLHRSRSEWRQ